MIILHPYGGLCNRLRAITSGISLAKTFNQPLEIHWFINNDLNAPFEDLLTINQFKNVSVKSFKQYSDGDLKYHINSEYILEDYFLKQRFSEGYFDVSRNLCLDYFSNIDFDNNHVLIKTVRKFFSYDVSLNFLEPINSLRRKIDNQATIINKSTIGVHIRRTDNILSIERSPTNEFIKKMNEAINNDNNTNFFLSTDCPEEEKKILKEFGDKRIILHNGSKSRLEKQGMQQAIIDLYLLSKCSKIIGSFFSTFSLVASEISSIPIEIINIYED